MKKFILAVLLLSTTSVFAQDLENKMGETYLPQAGDWAIGIDATPFLSYFGNFIGGSDGNAVPTWNYLTTNQTITGKYFVADDMAYRASLRIGFASNSGSEMVFNRGTNPADIQYPSSEPAMVENTWKSGMTNIGLAGGLEMRRGFGRLQGFYGGELGIAFSSSGNKFTYGNAYNSNATFNVSADPADDMDVDGDGSADNVGVDPFGNSGRLTESKSGTAFGVGLRGFIGAEYFVLPRLAVGGEFGWGLMFMANGTSSSTVETEGFDSGGNEVQGTFTTEAKNGSGFAIDTDAMNSLFGPAGSLRVTLHF